MIKQVLLALVVSVQVGQAKAWHYNVTCVNEYGSVVYTNPDGSCPDQVIRHMYSDPKDRMLGEYLSDIGRAANIAAERSGMPDISTSNLQMDNRSASDSSSSSNSSARSNQGQGQLQNQSQQQDLNNFIFR